MSTILELAQGLQHSDIGVTLAENLYAFPVIEAVHLVGLALSVGLIFLTDLRLVGLFLPRVPVSAILRQLRPWVLGGFAITFVSGFLLFWSEAATVVVSPAFPAKFLFIFLAGVNALWFELKLGRNVTEWEASPAIPAGARYAGLASLSLWTLVIISGRLIPYLP